MNDKKNELRNMGGVTSKATETEIEHLLLNVMDKQTESCQVDVSSDTAIHVSSGGWVDIENIDVDATMSLDFECTVASMQDEDFANNLKDDISDYVKTKGVAVLSSLSKNTTDAIDNFITNITTKLSDVKMDDFKTYLENKFDIDVEASKQVVIKNINITDKKKLILQEIVKHSDVRKDIASISKTIDDHLDSKEDDLITKSLNVIKNLFSNPIFIIGIVVVGVAAVLFFLKI